MLSYACMKLNMQFEHNLTMMTLKIRYTYVAMHALSIISSSNTSLPPANQWPITDWPAASWQREELETDKVDDRMLRYQEIRKTAIIRNSQMRNVAHSVQSKMEILRSFLVVSSNFTSQNS